MVGAERVLRLLPRGTHDYGRFLRPSELDRAARATDLELVETAGMRYDPFTRRCRLGGGRTSTIWPGTAGRGSLELLAVEIGRPERATGMNETDVPRVRGRR